VSNIEFLLNRLKKSKEADEIIVCTTTNKSDNELEAIAKNVGVKCFRGSELDKIDRWYRAAKKFEVDYVVTADGDDLFCEPIMIDLAFKQLERGGVDFIEEKPGALVPIGAFTYAFTVKALEKVWDIKDSSDTEMMSVYFTDSGFFSVKTLEDVPLIFKCPEIRMTLDYEDDLKFFTDVITNIGLVNFDLYDIIVYLHRYPEVVKINQYLTEAYLDNQKKKTNMVIKKNPTKYFGNEMKYVQQVLNSEDWSATSGNWNGKLEQEFAKTFGAKYAVAFNSGTSTLHASLKAVGVNAGDEVISPALTVIMNSTATFHANAIPVYADVDPHTFLIDIKDVERKITPRTKAIMVVTLYGLSMDMEPVMCLAKKHGLAVIEDNAQCVCNGFTGDIASYSFENTKHISCGEGGIIITDNEEYAETARKIGGHGFKNLRAEEGRVRLRQDVFQDPHYKRHDILGWNYRLSEFGAAIALAQLEQLDTLVDLRVRSANMFKATMHGCDYLTPQVTPSGQENSYYTLGVIYDGEEKIGVSWQDFRAEYIKQGGDGIYGAWSVPYLEPMIAERQYISHYSDIYEGISYRTGLCPIAESVQPKIMQFKTNYRDLDLAKQKALCLAKTIEKFGE